MTSKNFQIRIVIFLNLHRYLSMYLSSPIQGDHVVRIHDLKLVKKLDHLHLISNEVARDVSRDR